MKYRYLTFDCYGTLIDWRKGIETELRASLGPEARAGRALLDAYIEAEKEQEASYKKYRDVLALSALSLSRRLGSRMDEGKAREFAASVPRWPAFPDTRGFLREMGVRGHKRYILSNVDNDLLEGTLKGNRLEVDGFVTAEEVGSYKPDTGHWREFFRRTGAEKDEVLHVAGSVFHDIIPAAGLGLATAWVNRYAEPMPPEAAPTYVCDTLANLAKAIG